MKSPVVMFALGILFAVAILAQDTGSITGTVRDTTGGVIPGAKVTLRNTAQGSLYKTISNGNGDYLVAGLPAGRYDLSISVKDFKGYEARGIVLRVAQKARADAVLVIGDVTSAITVPGEGLTLVETQSSEVSGSVTGKADQPSKNVVTTDAIGCTMAAPRVQDGNSGFVVFQRQNMITGCTQCGRSVRLRRNFGTGGVPPPRCCHRQQSSKLPGE